MKRMVVGMAILVLAITVHLCAEAPAQAVTYDYTGNPYTTVNDSTLGDYITATVTFDSTVGSDYTGVVYNLHYVSWSISSGSYTITSTSPNIGLSGVSDFSFQNGKIDGWEMAADQYMAGVDITIGTDKAAIGFGDRDQIYNINENLFNAESGNPGTWTLETPPGAVPEPCTMLLLGSGLASLAAFRKKFRA
jgi:hypothetical protein